MKNWKKKINFINLFGYEVRKKIKKNKKKISKVLYGVKKFKKKGLNKFL